MKHFSQASLVDRGESAESGGSTSEIYIIRQHA